MYADKYGIPPVTGKTDEDVTYSQKDLDEAKRYRSAGYWGPSESGDMDIEFRKRGLVSGEGLSTRYVYPGGWWSNSQPTGPNIADPAVYKYVPQSSSGTGTNTTSGEIATLIPLNCADVSTPSTWYKEYLGRCGEDA